jgi:peroxin-7
VSVCTDARSTQTIRAHNYEVLTVDWNKYNEYMLMTGSVDKTIRAFDIRNAHAPVQVLNGHQFAVRRIKCSPHSERIVASAS